MSTDASSGSCDYTMYGRRMRTLAVQCWLVAFALSGVGCRERTDQPSGNPPLAGKRPGVDGDGATAPGTLEARIEAAMRRGAAYLVARQGQDGAFRSEHYAAFKDGYSLSPLALLALWAAPRDPAVTAAFGRGLDFVATLVTADGALRVGLGGPTYPYYAIAGTLLALSAAGPAGERHEAVRQALIGLLRERQFGEARGWTPEDPSYGGWGYYPDLPDKDASGGLPDARLTANLSATVFSIGALRLAGVPAEDPALQKARAFVERCQNWGEASDRPAGAPATMDPRFDDGGFFFSPLVPDSNKAGVAGTGADGRTRYRSYGSMTADGLRALLRLGVPFDHERVQAAARWMTQHFSAEANPGAFPAEAELRRASSYYYYVWTAAHALRAMGATEIETGAGRVHWAHALAEGLLARQRPDGSWANASMELREDDPLVATPFAMAALGIARMVLTGEYRSHGPGSSMDAARPEPRP
jgi:squalene-hopene/tetraprenyl-beta-curcumene cyclase